MRIAHAGFLNSPSASASIALSNLNRLRVTELKEYGAQVKDTFHSKTMCVRSPINSQKSYIAVLTLSKTSGIFSVFITLYGL